MSIPFSRVVRLAVYERLLGTGRAPAPADLAAHLGSDEAAVRAALEELHAKHLLYLDPASRAIVMAWPLSGVETPYSVEVGGVRVYANCAWDQAGIPAMLGIDMHMHAPCAQTGDMLHAQVKAGRLVRGEGVVHFLVPPRHWYDDLAYT
jgi:hypothetical protein